jgi:hypothetical protein
MTFKWPLNTYVNLTTPPTLTPPINHYHNLPWPHPNPPPMTPLSLYLTLCFVGFFRVRQLKVWVTAVLKQFWKDMVNTLLSIGRVFMTIFSFCTLWLYTNNDLFSFRMFIWRSLLQLPENHAAFCSLVDKGTHSAFVRLHEKYPIKSRKLLRVLQRLVHAWKRYNTKCHPILTHSVQI